jgi:hypothetical protein
MKKALLLILFSLPFLANAQTKGFNYQAIILDSLGRPIVSKNIKVQFSLIPTSTTSTAVYTEEHSVKTSESGEVNLVIGTSSTVLIGTNLSSINWNVNPMYLSTKIDLGNGFKSLGTSPLQLVPYALNAANGLNTNENNISAGTDALKII